MIYFSNLHKIRHFWVYFMYLFPPPFFDLLFVPDSDLFVRLRDEVEEEGGGVRVGDHVVQEHRQVGRVLQDLLHQSINQSINQSIIQSTQYILLIPSINQWINGPIDQWINLDQRSMNQWINLDQRSINQSINQSMKQ